MIVSNYIFGQSDTIYAVLNEINERGNVKSFVFKDYKRIYFRELDNMQQAMMDERCNYYSLKDSLCYELNHNKKEGTSIIETKNKIRFYGLLESGSSSRKTISKIKKGLEVNQTVFDSLKRKIQYSKIKYGKIEEGYNDRSIFHKPYIEYYPNGMVKMKSQQKSLKFYGKYKEFYLSGKVKIKGKYNKKGEQIGSWKYYDVKGKLIKKENH